MSIVFSPRGDNELITNRCERLAETEMSSERPAWKTELQAQWEVINLSNFCAEIGIDYQSAFVDSLARSNSPAYEGYVWEILPNTKINQGVLHGYPASSLRDRPDAPVIWEEWFFVDGEMHHHVLANFANDRATDTWQGDSSDVDHPAEVLNIQWRHFNDAKLIPYYFQ